MKFNLQTERYTYTEKDKAALEELGCVFEKTPATHDVYAPLTPSKHLCTKCGGSGKFRGMLVWK